MDLTKCPNGHYYDKEKFLSCPHCAHIPVVSLSCADQSGIETAEPNDNAVKQINHTLRKTTGWLVCTNGNMIGQSFPLLEGSNQIGRSTTMDIILLYENSVSREDHACITYDPSNQSFTLSTDQKENVTRVNEKDYTKPIVLHDRDSITLVTCTLTFVPFCNTNFQWEQIM